MSLSLVTYDSSGSSSEDEGAAQKPRANNAEPENPTAQDGNVTTLLTSLPAPKSQPSFAAISSLLARKDKNGKAMISVPVAPDSDSDDDVVPAKKRRAAVKPTPAGKSGLMSMLPQPKNIFQKAKVSIGEPSDPSITAEEGDAMRSKNRNMPSAKKASVSLTPYVLGKKKDASSSDAMKKKPITADKPAASKKVQEDDDNEEDDCASFFSFHSKSDNDKLLAEYGNSHETEAAATSYATTADARASAQVSSSPAASGGDYGLAPTTASAPASDYSYGDTAATENYPATGPSLEPAAYEYSEPAAYGQAEAAPYGDGYAEAAAPPEGQYTAYAAPAAASSQPSADLSNMLGDEQFKRLSRGGKRVQQELAALSNSIVDFDENERSQQYNALPSKYMSEEKATRAPASQQPSRVSKNKHQITYLAFQAKERELELRNQWSENHMTKKQTQAKYGF